MLEWDDLRSFLAIARHGSLSAAARMLGVEQSTMGRRLAALEQRSGVRLLQKIPRGFVLTAAGEAILAHVERIEHETLAVERAITGKDVRLAGTVRLTTLETFAVEVLTPALAAFREKYPGITVELLADTRALSLARREADIALRLARPTQAGLVVRKAAEIGFALYAAPAYLDRHGPPDFTAGAPGHAVIRVEEDLIGTPDMAWFTGLTAQSEITLRTNTRYAHLAAARAGMGIACLARYLGDPATGLVRLAPPVPAPVRELFLVVHADIRHTPRIRALTEMLTATLKRQASLLNPE